MRKTTKRAKGSKTTAGAILDHNVRALMQATGPYYVTLMADTQIGVYLCPKVRGTHLRYVVAYGSDGPDNPDQVLTFHDLPDAVRCFRAILIAGSWRQYERDQNPKTREDS